MNLFFNLLENRYISSEFNGVGVFINLIFFIKINLEFIITATRGRTYA
jgi:hypothetical protein